ncbi:hypothetical protein PV772_18320 [Pseudarthrobacter sp. CC12]|uniref:hypothetical protein n=1 Tax=Pseudarthrobacter sp. CC12 TaxID=3029193 RepID=UPI003267E5CE
MSKTPAQRIKKHGSKASFPQHQLPPVITPTAGNPSKKTQNNGNVILIAGVAASLFLFWYLHLLTLNQMTQLSGGLAMPDSLMGGFSVDYVGDLRARMNEDALGQLSYIHKTAGTLFPIIFGFSWLLLIGTNVANRVLRGLLGALLLLFIIIRLSANVAVDTALAAQSLEPGTVVLASALTVAGWVLLLLSVTAGGAAVVLRRWARRQGRRP